MMTWDELLQQGWLQLTVTVVGGPAVAAITSGVAAIFSKRFRARFW